MKNMRLKRHVRLLQLNIKGAFLFIPRIIAGSVLVIAILLIAAFAISNISSANANQKLKIGMYIAEDNERFGYNVLNIINSIDTVNTVCDLELTDYDSAVANVKNGDYTAAILIPEGFIDGLINGNNIPVEIVYAKESMTVTSQLFQETLRAGASDISTAEASVYAADAVVADNSHSQDNLAKVDEELTWEYLTYALDRAVYIDVNDLAGFDGLNQIQIYICAALVLFLVISSITVIKFFNDDSEAMRMTFRRKGILPGFNDFCKVLAVSVCYTFFLYLIYIILIIMTHFNASLANYIKLPSLAEGLAAFFAIWLLTLSVFMMLGFIFKLIGNEIYAVIASVILAAFMTYIAGGITTLSSCPLWIRNFGRILPVSYSMRLAGKILNASLLTDYSGMKILLVNLLFIFIFVALTALIDWSRSNLEPFSKRIANL